MYKEHRTWLKKKILHGDTNLEDYEVLELLLSYALPMKNTNIISDNLIRKFGKLHKIFDAPISTLEEVAGVGKSTAVFIKCISKLVGFYFESKYIEKEKILSLNNLRKKITLNFVSQTEEAVVVTLLGKNGKLIYSGIVYRGNFNSVDSYIRKIIELIVLYNASSVIISHNHLNGLLLPSKDDIYSFESKRQIKGRLEEENKSCENKEKNGYRRKSKIVYDEKSGGNRMISSNIEINKRQNLERWKKQIEEQKKSGLSVKQWCEKNNMPIGTYWSRKSRVKKGYLKKAGTNFVEVTIETENPSKEVIASIKLGNTVAEVYTGADEKTITEVLRAMKNV